MTSDTDLPRQPVPLSFSEKNIHRIVSILKWYYFVLVCLEGFIIFGRLLTGYPLQQLVNHSLFSLIPLAIFLGLNKRKSWVIIIIVVYSALSFLMAFFLPVPSPSRLDPFEFELITVIGLLINAFNLYFFTRKEVRKYFKATDIIIY